MKRKWLLSKNQYYGVPWQPCSVTSDDHHLVDLSPYDFVFCSLDKSCELNPITSVWVYRDFILGCIWLKRESYELWPAGTCTWRWKVFLVVSGCTDWLHVHVTWNQRYQERKGRSPSGIFWRLHSLVRWRLSGWHWDYPLSRLPQCLRRWGQWFPCSTARRRAFLGERYAWSKVID